MPTKTQLRHAATVNADAFFSDYQSGMDQRAVARKYGVSQGLVSSLLKAHPQWVERRKSEKQKLGIGSDCFKKRMANLADSIGMFAAYQDGMSQYEIANHFETSQPRVASLLGRHPDWGSRRAVKKQPPLYPIKDGKRECSFCHQHCSVDQFDKKSAYCIDCRKTKQKEWRLANPERQRYAGSWQQLNPEWRSKYLGEKYRRLKSMVFEHYGHCCARCGFSDIRAIHVDHVNEDGADERRKLTPLQVVQKIVRLGFPDSYQLLCANCNTIKGVEAGTLRRTIIGKESA